MKAVDPEVDVLARILLYGQPGSTKTRTAASAALDDRTYPCLMVSMAGNPLSIRDYVRRPDILELDTYKDLNAIYAFFARGQPEQGQVWEALGRPKLNQKYKCLIMDGITNLQRRAASEAAGNEQQGPGDMPNALQQQHHGQILARMLLFADKFFALPGIHVIMTALEYEMQDASANTSYRVQLTGQAASELPSYAYMVGRLVPQSRLTRQQQEVLRKQGGYDDDTVSVLFTQPNARWYAKNQYGPPIPAMPDPTMTKILDAIKAPGAPGPLAR